MKQLECVYLMNVALYLKLTDIATFVNINHKTKEACDGLRINPINNDEIDLKKSLKIINSYFPKLETLYLTKQSFETICSDLNNYELPNVELFKSNDFVRLSFIIKSPTISDGINKAFIDNGFEKPHDSFSNVQSIKMNMSSLFQIEYSFGQMKSLKRIVISCDVNEITKKSFILDQINSFAKECEVILEVQHYWDKEKPNWDRFKELKQLLNQSIIVKYDCNYGIKEQYKMDQFPETQEEFDGDLWFKRISKEYYPPKLIIKHKQNTEYLKLFESVKTIEINAYGTYQLPSSVDTVSSNMYSQVNIDNWDELNEIKSIKHYDYNINTPLHYRSCEIDMNKRTFDKKLMVGSSTIRIITIILSLLSIVQSIFENGLFNLKEHYITLYPFLTISLITYIITFGLLIIHSNWKSGLIDRLLISGLFLLIIQYLIILYYDQKHYGMYYSEVMFIIIYSVLFYFLDLFIILVGFGSGYLRRKLGKCNTYFDNFNESIFEFIGNAVNNRIKFKIMIVILSFPFNYCYILSLFTTNGFLFVGNLINTIITIGISGVLFVFGI